MQTICELSAYVGHQSRGPVMDQSDVDLVNCEAFDAAFLKFEEAVASVLFYVTV